MYIFRHCIYKRACTSMHIVCVVFNYVLSHVYIEKEKTNSNKSIVEECSENIDGNEIISTINITLFVIFFIVSIGISSFVIYFLWYLTKRYCLC